MQGRNKKNKREAAKNYAPHIHSCANRAISVALPSHTISTFIRIQWF